MYWKIALILAIFLIIDIVGHFCLKIKRNIFEWLILMTVILCMTGSIAVACRSHFEKKIGNSEALYMSYKYLEEENIEQCRLKLSEVKGNYANELEIIDIFADMISGNYKQGYFKILRLVDENKLNTTNKKYLKELQGICENKLGIAKDSENEEIYSYDEYLKKLSAEDNSNSVKDSTNEEILDLLDKYVKTLGFTNKEVKNYDKEYEIDKKLYATDISEISKEDINEIVEEFGNTEDVLRLQCKYYVNERDYESAKNIAYKLVNKYEKESNYVIYTDIIAQEAYQREKMLSNDSYENIEELYDLNDTEIKNIVKKANNKVKKAKNLEENGDYNEKTEEKIDNLKSEAEELYKEANYISVRRAINYIIAKKNLNGDSTGMYDLQLAKLYIIVGEKETAHEYLYEVIDNSIDISEDSYIKDEIDEVVSMYNQISVGEDSTELNLAIDELIDKQSNGVVPLNEESINGVFDAYVSTSLKYDKISIHISRIDTSDYPTVRAYININGDIDGTSQLASDFEKEDFYLVDTQHEIDDFEMLKNEEDDNVNISIVMDRSGSMQGIPIENAKLAANEVVEHMDSDLHKISIISYSDNATVDQALTYKKESLKKSIDTIEANGGTYIAKGLIAGINEIKYESGAKAIILMSDGQDGSSSGEMEEAINLATEEGISIYTVAFGNCNEEYMASIAEATGGKFIKASNSTELSDIYLTLQKYIINNYCIEYQVTKDEDITPRYIYVNVNKYNTSATKTYFDVENDDENDDDSGEYIEKAGSDTLAISSVKANSASVQDVSSGIELTIEGIGFEEGIVVTIGEVPLIDIVVNDDRSINGTLKGKLSSGRYDVKVKTKDGKIAIGSKMFNVFKSGSISSVKVGSVTITADSIGQTGDATFLASGNVMINDFIHSAGDMEITVNNTGLSELDFSADTVYLGDNGKLSGESKLYVSYAEQESKSGSFASLVMGGKDYVIQKNKYAINVDKEKADFEGEISDFDLSIPFIMDIDVAEVMLYSNRIQVDIKTFNMEEIVEKLDKATSGNKKSENNEKSKTFDIKDAGDLALSLAITPNGVEFGGEVKLNVNDSISFSNYKINEASIKLNSLDKDKEYWKIGGKIDFNELKPSSSVSGVKFAGFEGYISSYYWLPDKIEINSELKPGVVFYKVIELNEVGGSMQGISTLVLKLYEALVDDDVYEILGTGISSDEYDYQDVILQVDVGAEANIFAELSDNKLFEKFKEWGEIGEIEGSAGINFSEIEIKIEAEMNLLGSEKAKAEATLGKSGLDIKAGVDLDLSGFGLKISGGADANVGANLTGVYIGAGVNGKLKCSALDINYTGNASFKIEFDWEFDKASVTVNYKDGAKDKEGTLWYDDNGGLFIWDKISVTTN